MNGGIPIIKKVEKRLSEIKYRSNNPNALVRGERMGDFIKVYNHEGKHVAYEYEPVYDQTVTVAPLTINSYVTPMTVNSEAVGSMNHGMPIITGFDKVVDETIKETREIISKANLFDKYKTALENIVSLGHVVNEHNALNVLQHIVESASDTLNE